MGGIEDISQVYSIRAHKSRVTGNSETEPSGALPDSPGPVSGLQFDASRHPAHAHRGRRRWL
jgi:hypothetical protein